MFFLRAVHCYWFIDSLSGLLIELYRKAGDFDVPLNDVGQDYD